MDMKTLWIAVLLAFTGCLAFAQDAAPAAEDKAAPVPPKLKVRWTEKKKDGKRIVTVYVKNEGMMDLKDAAAEIILKGQTEKERQKEKVSVSVPRNQEKSFDVILAKNISGYGTDGFASALPGIEKISAVEVVMGELIFAAK
jgi:hypothetical protein